MAPQGADYNVDWVFSNTSDVHVAKHRDWFKTFTPFHMHLGSLAGGSRLQVEGFGDVELEVRKVVGAAAKKNAAQNAVLSSSATLCSLLAVSATFLVVLSSINTDSSYPAGRFWKLWLKGQPQGLSSLDPDRLYYINATMSDEERARLTEFKRNNVSAPSRKVLARNNMPSFLMDSPAYTGLGLDFLKSRYTDESQFLASYGYSLDYDEDRALGRRILRAFMQRDKAEAAAIKPRKVISEPSAPYTAEEKAWLKENFGGEFRMLREYGLEIYNERDRAEGRDTVRALMSQDSNDDTTDVSKLIGEDGHEEEDDDEDDFLADLEADVACRRLSLHREHHWKCDSRVK